MLSSEDIAATLRYARAAKATSNTAACEADWADFSRWGAERDAPPLPCPPGLLCGYLSVLAERGLAAATITRRASAIAHRHRSHGLEPPNGNEAVRQVLHGIRRALATAPKRKAPATHDLVLRMMDACPDILIGLRARALLALTGQNTRNARI